MSRHRESQAAHRADGHPTVGQGTSLGNGSLVPSSIPPHHLLVAPTSAPSASKGVRWPMSGTALPVPGLSPALATRCRDSPAAGLVAAVSRDEEDAWKRSRRETERRCLSRSEQRQHGWGTREEFGAHRHKMLLFSCRPVHVAGAGAARQPAPRGYSWIRPMAPGTARQERLQGCRGGEDMNQSGVPSPAGGSWPVRQLPITQPGSVYSRSTTPHRLPCQAGEGNVLLGWGWHSRRALFGGQSPSSTPGRCCGPGFVVAVTLLHGHTAWAVTAPCLALIKQQPGATPRSSQYCRATLGMTHGQPKFTGRCAPPG